MNLNKKIEYAISILIYVQYSTKSGGSVTAKQIYDATDIPPKYLTVILSELQRALILKSTRGFKGGYVINKPLKEINLYDIVSATTRTSLRQEKRSENQYQIFAKDVIKGIEEEYKNILSKTDLETLFKRFENLFSPMTPMFYI